MESISDETVTDSSPNLVEVPLDPDIGRLTGDFQDREWVSEEVEEMAS